MESFLKCNLTNIKYLNLSGNLIGNLGVKYLVKADMQNLSVLYIGTK